MDAIDHLIRLTEQVKVTRAAQAKYFRTRTSENLSVAKMAEASLDKMADESKAFIAKEQGRHIVNSDDQIALFGQEMGIVD